MENAILPIGIGIAMAEAQGSTCSTFFKILIDDKICCEAGRFVVKLLPLFQIVCVPQNKATDFLAVTQKDASTLSVLTFFPVFVKLQTNCLVGILHTVIVFHKSGTFFQGDLQIIFVLIMRCYLLGCSFVVYSRFGIRRTASPQQKAKNKEIALKFALYLTNEENQLELGKLTNVLAVNKKSSKLLDLRLEEEISKDEFKEKKAKIDAYNSVIRQLEKNKTLRNTLKDDSSKENLKNALKALLTELEDAE